MHSNRLERMHHTFARWKRLQQRLAAWSAERRRRPTSRGMQRPPPFAAATAAAKPAADGGIGSGCTSTASASSNPPSKSTAAPLPFHRSQTLVHLLHAAAQVLIGTPPAPLREPLANLFRRRPARLRRLAVGSQRLRVASGTRASASAAAASDLFLLLLLAFIFAASVGGIDRRRRVGSAPSSRRDAEQIRSH